MNNIQRVTFLVFVITAICSSCMCGCANARHFQGIELDSQGKAAFLHVPPVEQTNVFRCGYASMASVALYHGIRVDQIIEDSILQAFGCRDLSAKELLKLIEVIGLQGFAYQGSLEDLLANIRKGRPVLAMLHRPPRTGKYPTFEWFAEIINLATAKPHWIIVTGFNPQKQVLIFDPAKGYLAMSELEFDREWRRANRVCVLVNKAFPVAE